MLPSYPALSAIEIPLVRRSPDPRIQASFAFIESNLDQRILLIDLARLSGLSTARFSHLFARSTGMTPGRYIRVLREQLAAPAPSFRSAPPSRPSPARRLRISKRELD